MAMCFNLFIPGRVNLKKYISCEYQYQMTGLPVLVNMDAIVLPRLKANLPHGTTVGEFWIWVTLLANFDASVEGYVGDSLLTSAAVVRCSEANPIISRLIEELSVRNTLDFSSNGRHYDEDEWSRRRCKEGFNV